ncbi:hypothetical protein [Paraburkholderia aromaticivorans]|uniref:hypothetical protein n=1 Tax=Paraburkholderia aromaticivorans TaxID=2026199 RepID=UPI0038B8BF41
MRPSELKLLTESLEAKGYSINKGKTDGKVFYEAIYSAPTIPDLHTVLYFEARDHQTIYGLIIQQQGYVEGAQSEIDDYTRKLNNKIIGRHDLVNLEREQTVDELWNIVKAFYEKQIAQETKHMKLAEIVVSHLKEIQDKQ